MFNPVTKYDVNVDTMDQLPHLLCQAFREATSGAPGPVHLDLLGFAGEVIESAETTVGIAIEERYARYPAYRPAPDTAQVKRAAALLKDAKRPVIVAGGGAVASSAGFEIVELSETLSIPVATSNDGKGIILDTHPLSIGVAGSYSCQSANRIITEADLVLFIGCSTGDQVTHNWTVPPPDTPVIQIDINPSELGRSYRNALGLFGDARVTVQRLTEHLGKTDTFASWTRRVQEVTAEWKASIEPLRNSGDTPIRPERLCKELTEALPPDVVLVADTGYSAGPIPHPSVQNAPPPTGP
jgi:acetolactate synthase-1/2/3 large subunit